MGNKIFLTLFFTVLLTTIVSAAPILDQLHLNIQTTDASGNVITGTYAFVFNISTTNDCANVVYSNSTSLTTDSRGIISHYLEDTNLDYDSQYYLCYYRDGSLIETSEIARTPYSFTAQNVTTSGIIINSNLNLGSYNLTANYLFGDGSGLTNLNVSAIDLSDYFTKSEILGFNYWNSTFAAFNKTYADTLYYGVNNPSGFYNSTNFVITNYALLSTLNNGSYLNVAETDPFWSANYSTFLTNNISLTNYANFLNTSNNNYIVEYGGLLNASNNNWITQNNNSVNNYILWVNSTSGGAETDPFWSANSTLVPYLASANTFTANNIFNQNLTVDTTTLFVNSANDRVGIGTTNPAYKLEVNGTALIGGVGTYGSIALARSSDGAGYGTVSYENTNGLRLKTLGGSGSSYIAFQTAGTADAVRIIDGGNVGIGTTSPSNTLQIGSIGASGYTANELAVGDGTNVFALDVATGVANLWATGDFRFLPGSSEKVRITSTGNVGIGTTAPASKLNILSTLSDTLGAGTITIGQTADTTNYWTFRQSSTANFAIDAYYSSAWTNKFYIERSTGNVGIGTTAPGAKLEVAGGNILLNQNGGTLILSNGAGGTLGSLGYNNILDTVEIKSTYGYGTHPGISFFTKNGGGAVTETVRIDQTGNVGIGTTSPQTKLHVNGSAVFNGTINLDSNKIINIGNGTLAQDAVTYSQLLASVGGVSETDPFWSANYSTFLTNNQSLTNYANFLNTSNNNYIVEYGGLLNTSNNNYILANNQSVNNYITQNNNSVLNYILYVNSTNSGVSYSDLWINSTFYNTTQVNAINTSMKNYVDSQDILFNTSNNNYLTQNNNSVNNYIVSYVGIQNASLNNYITYNNQSVNNYINAAISSGTANNSNLLDGYDSTFFMPLNTSVYGQFDFNGGWIGNGLSIINGNIYAQEGYFYKINSLTVTNLAVNGSLIPAPGFDNQFDIGNSTLRWNEGYFGGTVTADYFSGNGSQLTGISGSQINNNLNWLNSTTLPSSETDPFWSANYSTFLTNNISLTNYANFLNTSNNNYIVEYGGLLNASNNNWITQNNNSVNNYILWVNSTSGGAETDPFWSANSTLVPYLASANTFTANNIFNQNLTVDTTTLFVNSANDRVGIGTTNPAYKLEVNGTALIGGVGTYGSIALARSSDGAGYGTVSYENTNGLRLKTLGGSGSSYIAFQTAGTADAVRIIDGGNVGIGTTSPSNTLQIGSIGASGYTANELAVGDGTNVFALDVATGVANLWATGDFRFLPGSSEKVRITSTGNVGIGTTAPASKLNILSTLSDTLGAGTITIGQTADTTNYWTFRQSSTANFAIDAYYSSAWTNKFYIERSTGNVGIGTTAPGAKLEVAGGNILLNQNGGTLILSNGAGGTLGSLGYNNILDTVEIKSTYGYGTHPGISFFTKNGGGAVTETVRIDQTGNVGIGTTSPQTKLHVNGSAVFNGTINLDSNKIINIGNGTLAQDAVTYSQLLASVGGVSETDPFWTANYSTFLTNNISLTNYANFLNTSNNNYILANNQSVNNYILWVNSTNGGAETDPFWTANYSTFLLNNISITNTFGNYRTLSNLSFLGGNVGIGTTAPQSKLHIGGTGYNVSNALTFDDGTMGLGASNTGRFGLFFPGGLFYEITTSGFDSQSTGSFYIARTTASATVPIYTIKGDTNTGIGSAGADIVSLIAGGVNVLNANNSGNVGIGETAPGSKLSVSGGGSFGTGYDTTAAPTNGLIIEGNVGIGTTSPQYPLHIFNSGSNEIRVETSGNSLNSLTLLRNENAGSYNELWSWYMPDSSTDLRLWSDTAGNILTIQNTGNVGIGTTSPTAKLDVSGNSTFSGNMTVQNCIVFASGGSICSA